MRKEVFSFIVLIIFFFGCAGTDSVKRLGTGKPRFSTLEVEGISCFLSSENGYFRPGEDLKLNMKLKNLASDTKEFKIEKNTLFILDIFNEFTEKIHSSDILAGTYIGGQIMRLAPGEEKNFEITVSASSEGFEKASSVNCRIRLYFLPRQFRRNAVSIFVEKQ